MITYRRCTETNEDAIFEAFQTGFSDYMVKFELTKDAFFNHFFGPEGNSLEYSVIALDGEIPVFPNHTSLMGFVKCLNFTRNELS